MKKKPIRFTKAEVEFMSLLADQALLLGLANSNPEVESKLRIWVRLFESTVVNP